MTCLCTPQAVSAGPSADPPMLRRPMPGGLPLCPTWLTMPPSLLLTFFPSSKRGQPRAPRDSYRPTVTLSGSLVTCRHILHLAPVFAHTCCPHSKHILSLSLPLPPPLSGTGAPGRHRVVVGWSVCLSVLFTAKPLASKTVPDIQ